MTGEGEASGKPTGFKEEQRPRGEGGHPGGHRRPRPGGGPGGGGPRGARPGGGRPGGGRPGAGGAGARGARRKLSPQQIRQAKLMTDQSNIPFSQAVRIVTGKTTLNEVLQELMREEKIKRLIEAHGINRALATNIALGRTDLNIVLLRRRKNQTLHDHYTQSCLEDALTKKHVIALGLHGHRKLMGKIVGVDKYTIQFQEDKTPAPIEVHKTEIKFAYDPEQYKLVRKHMDLRKEVKALNLSPIMRARDRRHFKNLWLQESIDERKEVLVTTLEGDTFQGVVDWFGRWEFGLKFKGGARVTVFRHAVYEMKLQPTK